MARTPRERLERGRADRVGRQHGAGRGVLRAAAGRSGDHRGARYGPATKIRAVERMGGRVIQAPFADWWRTFETRTYPGVDATFIHAFDDLDVMAGNGTIALELLEDLPDLDAVVIPWGGGGLSCGIAAVLRQLAPQVRIYAAEVETAAPLAASLAAGEPRTVEYTPSFVDGIGSKMVFRNMFEHAQKLLDGSMVVTLQEAAQAMKLVAERNRVIVEGRVGMRGGGGAIGPRGRGQGGGDRLRRQYRSAQVRRADPVVH